MDIEINNELKDLIPPLTTEEYFNLEQSIIADGCRDSLILWGKTLVDGHNRYEICQKHNIEFGTIQKSFLNIEEVKDWIDFNQLARRNLTPDQRQILIGRRHNREKKESHRPEGTIKVVNFTTLNTEVAGAKPTPTKTAEKLAVEYKISEKTVRNYGKIAEQFEKIQAEKPLLAKEIWSGEKTLTEVKKETNNEIRKEQKIFKAQQMPVGVYDLVYCDPPWKYEDATPNRAVENHYPTMILEDICNMKLPELSKDCLLLMWTTAPKLFESMKVIESWGFNYRTHCIWDKMVIGMGYWFRSQHELLLVATKGSFSPPEVEFRNSSIYSEKRGEHSAKPIYFYDWIEKAFPLSHKIELFQRIKRKNWEGWGNE